MKKGKKGYKLPGCITKFDNEIKTSCLDCDFATPSITKNFNSTLNLYRQLSYYIRTYIWGYRLVYLKKIIGRFLPPSSPSHPHNHFQNFKNNAPLGIIWKSQSTFLDNNKLKNCQVDTIQVMLAHLPSGDKPTGFFSTPKHIWNIHALKLAFTNEEYFSQYITKMSMKQKPPGIVWFCFLTSGSKTYKKKNWNPQ